MLRGFVNSYLDLNLIRTSFLPVAQCSRRIWILVTGIYVSSTVPVMPVDVDYNSIKTLSEDQAQDCFRFDLADVTAKYNSMTYICTCVAILNICWLGQPDNLLLWLYAKKKIWVNASQFFYLILKTKSPACVHAYCSIGITCIGWLGERKSANTGKIQ